jgi:hypothetical protein
MWRRVDLVWTDVSEKRIASIFRVEKSANGNQREQVAVDYPEDEPIRSSETSVHTRSTRRYIPEDGILHSHCRENLKSYTGQIQFIFLRFKPFRWPSKLLINKTYNILF